MILWVMKETFTPDYTHILDAAENRTPKKLPLYEHSINVGFIEKAQGSSLAHLFQEGESGLREFFKIYCDFHIEYGYDTVSFENCITQNIQQGRALSGQASALFHNLADIEAYDWQGLVDKCKIDFDLSFQALSEVLPPGMKAVGGIGNGIFEAVQDFVPLTELAYMSIDDPRAYALLFNRVGWVAREMWQWFLPRYSDSFVLCRFGDDLGFKSTTLLNPLDIREHIIPQYKRVVELIHSYNKPFLLHSCGAIFDVMDDLIDVVKIDAKHSNEDQIAPFDRWTQDYGDRIGNFGGVETNILCLEDEKTVKEYVTDLCRRCGGAGGVAIGSGNQISDYIPVESFIAMTEAVRGIKCI
jgi:uroporphyrinogen decarboxylase